MSEERDPKSLFSSMPEARFHVIQNAVLSGDREAVRDIFLDPVAIAAQVAEDMKPIHELIESPEPLRVISPSDSR